MAFQFGFANDGGSEDEEDASAANDSQTAAAGIDATPVKQHKLQDLVGMGVRSQRLPYDRRFTLPHFI